MIVRSHRLLVLFAFSFCVSISLRAQKYTLRFDTVFHTIRQASYGKLRVIDLRANKESLGELKTGAFNRSKSIVTEQPLPEVLASYYDRMLAGPSNEHIELLLVVHGLKIEDQANNGQIGTFYLDVDLFGGHRNRYVFLSKIDSLYEATSGFDVSALLLHSVKQKMSSILQQHGSQRLRHIKDYVLDEEQVLTRRQQVRSEFPVYQAKYFKKGVYYTMEQFLNNSPVDTPFMKSVRETNWEGIQEEYFYYTNEKGQRSSEMKPKTFFAIYDGEAWSLSGMDYAQPMEFIRGDFYADMEFRGVLDGTGATTASMMGGLIGAAIEARMGKTHYTMGLYRSRFDPERKAFSPQQRLK